MKWLAFEKSVGGVIFYRQEMSIKFLLVQYRSGQWDFPKGHVEEGETEKETMLREIKEETKLDELEIFPNFRNSAIYFYSAWGNEKKERIAKNRGIHIFKKVVYYLAQTKKQEVEIDFENLAYRWLSFEDAYAMLGNKDSKKLLQRAAKFLADLARKE